MTGVGAFLRAFVQRDRWWYVGWGLALGVFYWSQGSSVQALYPRHADLERAAASAAGNTAFIAMAGPARALDTVGGQVAWQATAFGAVLAGLMSMFLIGRHTRAEEESNRDEILRAAPVGRHASFTAAVLNAMLANVLVGFVVTLGLLLLPLDLPDSLGLGVGLTVCGWCFTGVAAVAAQLTSSTRAMYGVVGAVIAASYGLRAIGDVGTPALSWLSPIGWYQAMHAFSGLRWWPTLLTLVVAAGATGVAHRLFDLRDYGSGLWASQPGPGRAGAALSSPFGLAWHLQRPSVVGWVVGTGLYGVAYGSIGDDVGALIGTSSTGTSVFVQGSSDLVDGFYAVALVFLALMASAFAVSSALRAHTDEQDGRLEPLVATGLSRVRWSMSQIATTVLGSALVLLAGGLGLGTGFWMVTHDASRVSPFVLGALGYLAPTLVLSGLARFVWGVAPRWAPLGWTEVAVAVLVLFFGPLLRLPGWVQGLSPFHHMALVPAQPFRWTSFVLLALLAAGLGAVGVHGFTRRDLD